MKEYLKSVDQVIGDVDSSTQGITSAEANARLEKNGKNKLDQGKKDSIIKKFFAQLADPMIIILLVGIILLMSMHSLINYM